MKRKQRHLLRISQPVGRCAGLSPLQLCLTRLVIVFAAGAAASSAFAAEHVTLSNGFDMICDHRVVDGDRTRLYLDAASTNFVEVSTASIALDEAMPPAAATAQTPSQPQTAEVLTGPELHEVLAAAGLSHNLDVDLLASVVHAESAGRVHARSRTGAEGLMQLMPGTAATLGVHDAYAPRENVGGGAAYLDTLLSRYRNNLALALAAYNAGPGAVDRWHGVPPYRETRLYVAHIIREFNARYAQRQSALQAAKPALAAAAISAGISR